MVRSSASNYTCEKKTDYGKEISVRYAMTKGCEDVRWNIIYETDEPG